ncbi:histidine triad nucleotide-binding protein [Paenibacillus chitinolyticus]|uniref:histidine triad nucleotide-binding protein n=1 Tax=Paenibacillus chitinolyticus TaxID=79263 RepID=UPI0036D932D8
MDCLFCKIRDGQIPSKQVYEDEQVLAFHDIQPAAPVHILIIPKKHIASMKDAGEEDWTLIGSVHKAAQQIARDFGIEESGYRLINNCGPDSGQVVFHIHYHLLGGTNLGPLVAQR